MKRFTVVKEFLNALGDSDVAIFSGKELNKEAFEYDREGNFYVADNELTMALALGVAISTDKKVFVFCNDCDFIRDLSSIVQMSISKCRNIFCVILNSGIYQEEGGQPTLLNSMYSPKGIVFNTGMIVHDFTPLFKNKTSLKELKNTVRGLKGPLSVFIGVDKGLKKDLNDVNISETDLRKRISSFIIE